MSERDDEGFEPKVEGREVAGAEPLEKALRERLRSVRSASERRTIAGLAREIGKLPGDLARAALEVSAGLAGVSLRVGVDFLRAVPEAARVLDAEELRAWGEMGRRLAMADAETGSGFFVEGVEELRDVPKGARLMLFQVCGRQLSLSTSVALETYGRAPSVARAVGDATLLGAVFEVALEVARRSARHSADFVAATPRVFESLPPDGEDELVTASDEGAADVVDEGRAYSNVDEGRAHSHETVGRAAVETAREFALRAGGIAADLWAALPAAVEGLSAEAVLRLFRHAKEFLSRGGAAALHATTAGGEVLRVLPEAFDEWAGLLHAVAEHSNAGLVALARSSPAFFRSLSQGRAERSHVAEVARRVLTAAREVARVDAEAAISCFRSAPVALRTTTVEQFERWAEEGLALAGATARARRGYYALETRRSQEQLKSGGTGLALEEVSQTLRLYVEALTGRAVEVAPLAAVPDEARIGDGRTIHLPSSVNEFGGDELDFRLYKVLAAHAAGQIEFGTHERETADLRAAFESISQLLRAGERGRARRLRARRLHQRDGERRARPRARRGGAATERVAPRDASRRGLPRRARALSAERLGDAHLRHFGERAH